MPESFASATETPARPHQTRRLQINGYSTPAECAEKLGISSRTLARLDASGDGPPRTQISGRVYYRDESIVEWLRSQEVRPPRRNERQERVA